MKVFSITWNTHGTKELPSFHSTADIVTISLQECYRSPNIGNIQKSFRHVASESMFGLQTIILSKSRVKVNATRIGLGPCGFVNKGFIVTRINRTILHVNTHLQAHSSNHNKRLLQLRTILEFCRAMDAEQPINTIILSGDFNFRMEGGIDQSADFLRLFPQFKEPEIKFQPTYKYEGNVLVSSRVPSYCDRVFVASKHNLVFLAYTSMSQVIVSDHKPVICEFSVKNSPLLHNKDEIILLCSRPRSMMLSKWLTSVYLFCIINVDVLSALVLLLAYSILVHRCSSIV